MMMIDPKVVELSVYNGIPHLLAPVVTDPKKAANTLLWAVSEMVRRYGLFAEKSVRDINSYNAAALRGEDDFEKMPLILFVIDELYDLMATTPTEVEDAIARLTAMADGRWHPSDYCHPAAVG
jgi:S-DNA-T family DNA segregation ATPase FtsK/SpoIIIE